MIVGQDGPAVVVSARTAAWLEHFAGLTSLRVRVRGTDPLISKELEEMRRAAMLWRGSATGTEEAAKPEPATSSSWLSTTEAASHLGITSRAVRKAIAREGLPAEVDHRGWKRIRREDVEHYRAARPA